MNCLRFLSLPIILLCSLAGTAQVIITNKGERIFIPPGNNVYVKGSYTNETPGPVANDNPQLVNYGSLFISGNITNHAPDNILETDGTGLLELNGTTDQLLSGSSSIELYRLNLNKTGALQLQRDIAVKNQINFSSGLINLNGNTIDLGTTGTLLNESNNKRIYSSTTGTVNYTLASSPVIGDIPGGLGLSLEGTVLTGTLIKRGHQPQSTAGDGSINRYFDVSIPAGETIHQLRVYYFDAKIPVGINEADLVAYISYDNGLIWQKIGGTVNTSSNVVQLSALSLTGSFRITLSEKDCTTSPIVNLGDPVKDFCAGTSITLDAGNPGAFYLWSTSATTQTITTSIAGLYSVVVRNARGCEGTDNITLVERPLPVANFTSGIACPTQSLPFNNTSTISTGSLTYSWDFGDPSVTTDVSTLQNPTYTYPVANDYTVNLTATSAYSCTNTIAKTITVYPLPQPDFTFIKACLGQDTEFTNASTITLGGMTYAWSFGDATGSTAINPIKTFSTIGTFDVQLTATSNAGCVQSVTKPVIINHSPVADFSITDGCEDMHVLIDNNSSIVSGTLTYNWDFGDASFGASLNPVKSYTEAGSYLVVLTATSGFNCVSTTSKSVTIYSDPVAAFTVNNDCEDKNFIFTNNSTSSQGIPTYLWDFDDSGTLSALANPSHIFANSGTYTVNLQVTSSFGCQSSINHPVTVYPAPVVDFIFSNACPEVAIPFTNATAISTGTVTYDWNFDNGTTSTLLNPSETFNTPGIYNIMLRATSDRSCVHERYKSLTVYAKPILDLGETIQTCGTSYILDALNPGSNYLWSTGEITQAITITSGGSYSVTITNENSCSLSEEVEVTLNDSVIPDLGSNRTVCGSIVLDAGYPGSTYTWSTGATTRTIDVSITGTYSVTVTDLNGCSGSDNVTITVNPAPYVNLGPDRSVCENVPLILDAANANSTYKWSDNSTSSTLQVANSGIYFVEVLNALGCIDRDTVNIVIHEVPDNNLPATINTCDQVLLDAGNPGSAYSWSNGFTQQRIVVTASGIYSVEVTTAENCVAQFSSDVTIKPGPVVNLGSDRSMCYGESVQLDAGNVGSTYSWSTNAVSKIISVSASGLYWVDVKAENGCIKRDTIIINVHPEIVNALPDSYSLCSNESRLFDATSAQAVSYEWRNAGGLIGTNPQINLENDGKYWVVMRDANNCTATDTVNVITDPDPITSRFLVATYLNAGDSVRFVQLSYPDPDVFDWDFKDGITSTESDPVHIYLRGGDFDASLTVTDPLGCSDMMSKVITVTLTGGGRQIEEKFPFTEILRSNLYPNPATQELNLALELNQETEIIISIYAANGKFIQSKQIKLKDAKVEFDVANLAKGIYILKISLHGTDRVMRFVKI